MSVSSLEWVVSGYALSFAVLMLTGGKLADMLGRRLIFVIGLAIFALSSLAAVSRGSADAADRRARRPGRRCRVHDARDALDHQRHLPAQAARHSDRHLGGRVGARARDRPARRRSDHRAHQLELDLLHQRSRRSARHRRRPDDHPRVEGHLARAAARHPGPAHLGDRLPRRDVRRDRVNRYGWGSPTISVSSRSPSSRSPRSSSSS